MTSKTEDPNEGERKALFREERFIDTSPENTSLIKIGEYVRTPLYEPSIRAMCATLSDVKKQLEKDLKSEKLQLAWKAASKMYHARSTFLKAKFQGPEEYCIALICWTLDEPYKIYEEFNNLCRQLMTDAWNDFPYKSLFYLIIQAEMRMRNTEDNQSPQITIRQPITITSGLDFSIEEENEEVSESEQNNNESPNNNKPEDKDVIKMDGNPSNNNSNSSLKRNVHRVFRGFDFAISEKEFQPRNLVAFSHIMSVTLDGIKLMKILEEKGRSGRRVTLLEIDQISWSSRYIGSLSVFPVEKEVVIWPWIKFYVEKREMITKNVEKIVLKPTSQSFTGSRE